jgi:hypothetical protein
MERVQSRQIVGNEVSAKGPRGKPVERASAARCLTTPDPEKTHGRGHGAAARAYPAPPIQISASLV